MKETKENEQFEQNDEENVAEDIRQTEHNETDNEHKDSENETEKSEDKEDGGEWEELHRIFSDMVESAYRIHETCYEKLQECYQEKEITLPIDIEMVARKMNVQIEYDKLNFVNADPIDRNIAQLRYERWGESVIQIIVLDNSVSKKKAGPLSNLEKYAVAYELGKTIVREEMPDAESNLFMLNLKSRPCSLPRLSTKLENFEYEMCAIFLLLPMELFLEEFDSYIEEIEEHPILMDDWIEHLSEKAEIPNYQLINGYQYIKFIAYQYYKENLSQEVIGKDYRNLYNL